MVPTPILKFEELFERKKYDECHKIIKNLLQSVRARSETHDDTKVVEWKDVCPDIPLEALEIALEGNDILLEGMKLCNVPVGDRREQWNDLCQTLTKHYVKVKALSPLKHSPTITYLNTVHSIIWLETVKQNSNSFSFDVDNIQILFDCFKRVVLASGKWPCCSSGGSAEVLLLLAQATECFTDLEPTQCLFMVEISLLSANLLLELRDSSPQLVKDVIFKLNGLWPLIQVKLTRSQKDVVKSSGVNSIKFGLLELNGIVENWNIQELSESVKIISAVCLVWLGCNAESLNFIENHSTSQQFLFPFLKAFSYYHLGEIDSCRLNLLYSSQTSRSVTAQVHVLLLKGKMLNSLGEYSSAHSQFIDALRTNHSCYMLLYNILKNLKTSLHKMYEHNSQINYVLEDSIRALCYIYRFIKNSDYVGTVDCFSFENKVFSYLNDDSHVQKEDIFYIIGEELLWIAQVCGVSLEMRPSPSSTAAECFLDIFERKSSVSCTSLSNRLPCDQFLLQETATALLLAGKDGAAETVCSVALLYCQDASLCTAEDEESFLKGNICALMLMTCIKISQGQTEEGAVCLKRCKNTIIHSYFGTCPLTKGQKCHLFDSVASRVYLLLALLQQKEGNAMDARRSLRRAVVHNPGDAVILERCSLFEKETGMIVEVSDVSERAKDSFDVKKCKTATLRYLLTVHLPL